MKRFALYVALAGWLFGSGVVAAEAQDISELEFANQPISQILRALGRSAGVTIVPDETVTGNASYYFASGELEQALEVFLESFDLHAERRDGVYYVSKIRIEPAATGAGLDIDAEDVRIEPLLRRLSEEIGKTVLYDRLPSEPITIHSRGIAPEASVRLVMRRFEDYVVQSDADFFYVQRRRDPREGGTRAEDLITREDDGYSIDAERVRFVEAVDTLFRIAGREYALLKRGDEVLDRVSFTDKSFEELLGLLLELGNADVRIDEGVYYIFDVNRETVLKRLDRIETIRLEHLRAADVVDLFPSGLAGAGLYRIDEQRNALILSGSDQEIDPVATFVRRIDRPTEGKEYERFDLSYLSASEAVGLLPENLRPVEPVLLERTNSFVMLVTPRQRSAIAEYVAMIDSEEEGVLVKLSYIRAQDLIANLPPSVSEADIVQTGDPTRVFLKASKAKRDRFLRELRQVDTPVPQIRYELLVVQYQDSSERGWDFSAQNEVLESEDETQFLGTIGSLLDLNFDIVSHFGYLFAVNFSADVGNSTARVLADTTLNGLSGEEISFQNTNTFRYREVETDPDTGEVEFTGVTREITSGIILEVDGWVSGEGMISMNVSTEVSKRGADTSSTTGNPPPTSEKLVNTHVRTQTGRPVVIGGLLQQETDSVTQETPLLARIPLLGRLFRSQQDSVENTELVIYIVPHIEYPYHQAQDLDGRLRHLYESLVGRS